MSLKSRIADLYAKRSEGPVSALGVDRHERPNAAIQRPSKCRAAAFGLWPFFHCAAFNVAECLLCGRGEQTHPIE
jgi:hypothetical protein